MGCGVIVLECVSKQDVESVVIQQCLSKQDVEGVMEGVVIRGCHTSE